MTEFTLWIFLTSLWIWGIHFCFAKHQILWDINDWLTNKVPKWILKPLFKCPMCMASIHGTAFYLASPMPYKPLLHIMFMVCVCGLNNIIDGIIANFDE